MPANSGFFRMGSVSMARGGLLPALRHNKRALQGGTGGHIDHTRTPLNYALTPETDPQAINRYVNVLLAQHDIKPRKNAVIAIEVIFSLHTSWHERDSRDYFADCLLWVAGASLGEVLSFDVHLDESAPHAHALILPLYEGALQGRRLMGGIANIMRLRADFMAQVGIKYGLKMSKRMSHSDRARLSREVVSALSTDPATQSRAWAVISDHIKREPQAYADVLGISLKMQHKPVKSFVAIMTSKGKGVDKPP